MIPLPPEPSRGSEILTWARGIHAALRRLRLTPGPGIRISEGTNSTTISADPAKRGSPSTQPHPFQAIVPAPYHGTGTPPPSHSLKYAVQPGVVQPVDAAAVLPANLNEQFQAPDNTERSYLCLKVTLTKSTGNYLLLNEARYEATGTTIPQPVMTDEEDDSYPAQWHLPLFAVRTEGGTITQVEQYVKSSVSLSVIITYITCQKQQRSLCWLPL